MIPHVALHGTPCFLFLGIGGFKTSSFMTVISVSACLITPLLLFSHCHVWLFATPWTAARQASLSFTISQSLLKLISVESVMPSNHLILYHALLLLPLIFPSSTFFSNESALHIRWPNYWSFSMSPSNEYSGLISFRIDWFDLLAVQGTPIVFSSTRVQKHQLFSAQPSLWLNSHIHTRLL